MNRSIPRRTALILCLLLLPVLPRAAAQKPAGFPLRIGGGYEAGGTTMEFPGLPVYQALEFPEGSVSGYTFYNGTALQFSRVTDRAFFKDLVLILGTRFRSTKAVFVRTYPAVMVLLPGQPTPVEQRIESRLAFAVQELGLDFQLLYPIWGGLGLKGGLTAGYSSLTSWRLTQHLITPEDGRFTNSDGYPTEEDGRVLVLSSGNDVVADDGFRLGTVSLSLQYDLPLGGRMSVVPEIGISRVANNSAPVTGSSWNTLSFAGNLSLHYLFGSDEPVPTPVLPPTGMLTPEPPPGSIPPEDSLPRPIPLRASIDLFTLDGDTRQQTMRLVTTRNRRTQELALPPAFTFEPGETTLSARYAKIDPAGVDEFSLDSIARLDTARAESHLLNIIGSRMHLFPREKLRLVIPRSGGATEQTRAESVRSYLGDVWRIAPSRLSIERSGAGGKGMVRLAGSSALLAPLKAEWIEQRTVASPLQIDPRIEGGIGPRTWTLTLRRGDLIVARHTSESRDALSLDLALGTPAPGEIPAPLTAELTVSDSSGATAVARDSIAFVVAAGPTAEK